MTVPAAPEAEAGGRSRTFVRRAVGLAVTGVSLYIVFPAIADVFGSWDQIADVRPWWFAAMALLQVGSVVCLTVLQRLAFRVRVWLPVVTSQLAGAGFGRIVPGGGAAAAAMQYSMLTRAGIPPQAVASGLTAASLVTFAALTVMPLLALPGIIAGTRVPEGLVRILLLGIGLFVLLAALGALVLRSERAIRFTGRRLQRLRNRLRRKQPPLTDLPDRLARERAVVLSVLGARWWEALLAVSGKWVFDFLTLMAALAALGAYPAPTLVLLAYCAAQILGQIPLTPGGLGFVEAGLTGTLALAGVSAGNAVAAALAYRLFSYWLYLPAGLVAAVVHAHRYGRAKPAA